MIPQSYSKLMLNGQRLKSLRRKQNQASLYQNQTLPFTIIPRHPLAVFLGRTGQRAHDGTRTHDLILTKNVLCRLSYVGNLDRSYVVAAFSGPGRTRTYEGYRQRIYSPPPLPLGTLTLDIAIGLNRPSRRWDLNP